MSVRTVKALIRNGPAQGLGKVGTEIDPGRGFSDRGWLYQPAVVDPAFDRCVNSR